MLSGYAEEPRKAERANARVNGFQGPSKDLGAHVDTERRLKCRTGPGDCCRRGFQDFGKRPL